MLEVFDFFFFKTQLSFKFTNAFYALNINLILWASQISQLFLIAKLLNSLLHLLESTTSILDFWLQLFILIFQFDATFSE